MSAKEPLRIGTRGSDLALWQAKNLQSSLEKAGYTSELVIIKTKGDEIQHLSLSKLEGKGFFTTEIETALLDNSIDVAVHSLKDLPTTATPGLRIAGLSSRAAPNDLLIINPTAVDTKQIFQLKEGARVGTSSHRRKCWLHDFRCDLQLIDIRGNVPTRIEKLEHEGFFDAIVLAHAGIQRLGIDLTAYHVIELHPAEFIPAPAQGVVAYQIREDKTELHRRIFKISDQRVHFCTNVERGVLKRLEGGCHSPIGVYCAQDANGFFHAYAGYAKQWEDSPVFVRSSSGTTHGLTDEILNQIENKL